MQHFRELLNGTVDQSTKSPERSRTLMHDQDNPAEEPQDPPFYEEIQRALSKV